jgi:hypothetical protein
LGNEDEGEGKCGCTFIGLRDAKIECCVELNYLVTTTSMQPLGASGMVELCVLDWFDAEGRFFCVMMWYVCLVMDPTLDVGWSGSCVGRWKKPDGGCVDH